MPWIASKRRRGAARKAGHFDRPKHPDVERGAMEDIKEMESSSNMSRNDGHEGPKRTKAVSPTISVDLSVATWFDPSPLAPRRTAEEESRDRDLGFGSVIAASTARLLNRDGVQRRQGRAGLDRNVRVASAAADFWPKFTSLVVATYLC
jgi:hypothetical protein